MEEFKNIIDGKLVNSNNKEMFHVFNPANGKIVGNVQKSGPKDADIALKSASEAFDDWSKLTYDERSIFMKKAVKTIKINAEKIARLLTLEQGKPFNQAKSEVLGAAESIDYFIETAKRIYGEIIPYEKNNCRNFVIKQPVGVCIAISPWNYPVGLLSWKIGPALITGCTVVAKPSSLTPLSATKLVECFKDAGLPNGVLNIINGLGSDLGKSLITNKITRKVAFTGSSHIGKNIMRLSSENLNKISLELGNNAPFIVCESANISEAADAACKKSFDNMGQICNSINRIYVNKKIEKEFIEKMIDNTKKLIIANGMENKEADLGPMISDSQRKYVVEHIKDAVKKGGKIVYGGGVPAGKNFENGYFFMPTIITNVNHEMRVMKEETFGPIAPIMTFDNLEDVIKLANDSVYGLVAYIFSTNMKEIIMASESLEYGTVDVNNVSGGHPPFPYGGWKESGIGIELSHHGIEEYLKIKHIRLTF
jgi:succinate-semialdehyde dehydrogenase / glutarate-semialdehyde dehydrogenase